MSRLIPSTLALAPLALLATACGARTATIADDRDVYVETIADTICAEKDSCGEIGEEDSEYESYDACHDDAESFMRDWWPADQCDAGRINGDTFIDCDDRARLLACDGTLAEAYTAWTECNADAVCTDDAS